VITAQAFAGKRYAVLGLARSGAATVDALLASGAEVVAWDEREEARASFAGRAELTAPLEVDLTGFAGVVVSPGVPLNRHPIAARAAKFDVPLIGDIELFALARPELSSHKVVGITGTNGKSTTTALVHHILTSAGVPALMGGNIGLPILAQEALPEGGVYVLELSSFQIDLTYSLECDVAVLLNITPDHLDRYDSFDAYAAAKARLFAMQSPRQHAIVGIGDDSSALIARKLSSGGEKLTKIAPGTCMDQSRWPALQGPHNAQNVLAAVAVCLTLGIPEAGIDRGLETFAGLPHRMEIVGDHTGVLYINDSKATNQASAAPALAAYPPLQGRPRIHWIVGGQAKEAGLHELADWTQHCTVAYTIGEAGPAFADLLSGIVPVERCGTLAEAVNRAAARAQTGDVVLLSPACASFDQFRDFEERGEMFRQFVAQATGRTAA
jgi:UDP-N-acetylmuramoylalanine--D-glutamate ligase